MLKVTKRDLRRVATRRNRLHLSHPENPLLPRQVKSDYIGLMGERAFAMRFDLPLDLSDRPMGDNGIDFITPLGTVDVKTYLKPYNLLRQVNKPHARILVLAYYIPQYDEVALVGWEYDSVMVRQPTKDFGHGIVNHYMSANKLRKIEELEELLLNEDNTTR